MAGVTAVVALNTAFSRMDRSDHPLYASDVEQTTRSWMSAAIVDRNFLHVVDEYVGLRTFDVTDPSHPKALGTMLACPAMAADVADSRAVVVCDPYKVTVVDVSDPSRPTVRGSTDLTQAGGSRSAVTISGDLALILDGSALHIVDVHDPDRPMVLSVTKLSDVGAADPVDVAVDGQVAYVGFQSGGGMAAVDISDPRQPAVLGHLLPSPLLDNGNVGTMGIAVSDAGVVLVDEVFRKLILVDVSNPARPTVSRVVGLPGVPSGKLTVDGERAYVPMSFYGGSSWLPVPGSNPGLAIVDLADPANPHVVGTLTRPSYGLSVAASGAHAFVSQGDGVSVVDVGPVAWRRWLGRIVGTSEERSNP